MKKIKSENGVITMITLVTVLFMISFLISSYIIVANKVKTQKEMLAETKAIYEPKSTMEEIYNSYFSNENIIPIYTVEQLLNMGSGQQNVYINGKYYNFTNDENTIYMLMNDLSFRASDYEENKIEETGEYYWTPVGNRILEYENLTDEELADEEIVSNYFQAKFEGKNNIIEVIYLDENNTEYSKKYLASNNYSDVSDLEGTEISFTINGETYYAEEGMTWVDWVEKSEYNTLGLLVTPSEIPRIYAVKNNSMWYLGESEGVSLDGSVVIENGGVYVLWDSMEPA